MEGTQRQGAPAADRAQAAAWTAGAGDVERAKKLLEIVSLESQDKIVKWFDGIGRRWVKAYLRAEGEAHKAGRSLTPAEAHGPESEDPNPGAQALMERMTAAHGRGTPGHDQDASETLAAWARTRADLVRSEFVTSTLRRLRKALDGNGRVASVEVASRVREPRRLGASLLIRFEDGSAFEWHTVTTWAEGPDGVVVETNGPTVPNAWRADGRRVPRPTPGMLAKGLARVR